MKKENKTESSKKNNHIKLRDALFTATAIVNTLTLISDNGQDLLNIPCLNILIILVYHKLQGFIKSTAYQRCALIVNHQALLFLLLLPAGVSLA